MNKRQNLLILLLLILTAVLCSCGSNAVTITPEPVITQTPEPEYNAEAADETIITFTDIPDCSDSPTDDSFAEAVGLQESVETDIPSEEIAKYIGNKNSMKFHNPDCRSVGQMKESNKVLLSCTRSAVIDKGYKPCKHCNP